MSLTHNCKIAVTEARLRIKQYPFRKISSVSFDTRSNLGKAVQQTTENKLSEYIRFDLNEPVSASDSNSLFLHKRLPLAVYVQRTSISDGDIKVEATCFAVKQFVGLVSALHHFDLMSEFLESSPTLIKAVEALVALHHQHKDA